MNIAHTVFDTPIHELTVPVENYEYNGNKFYIKRDDLQPFSFGGNKVRIAQKVILDMQAKGKNCLITYGNIRSNLCRTTSNFCCALNIPCYVISVLDDDHGCTKAFNGSMVRSFGATVVTCAKADVPEVVEKLKADLIAQGLNPYYIKDDEAEVASCRAYIDTYGEIDRYQIDTGCHFDYIFQASGSGTTQAGMIIGKLLSPHYGQAGLPDPKIVGISISRAYQRGVDMLNLHLDRVFKDMGITVDSEKIAKEINFTDKYVLGGYSLSNEDVDNICADMVKYNGIECDQTYTGKAFNGMINYIKDNDIKNSNILFIHTGGLPLFFDYLRDK